MLRRDQGNVPSKYSICSMESHEAGGAPKNEKETGKGDDEGRNLHYTPTQTRQLLADTLRRGG